MLASSATIQLSPQWLALIVGSVIPLIVGLISKSNASDRLKALINGLLSALAGAGTTALTTAGKVEWQSWVIGILSTWIASIATYYGFWKPSGVEPAVSKATRRFGIGRRTPRMTRTVGLRGRLPVLPPHERLPLSYAHEYLAAPLPNPNYPIDVTEQITDFGMQGNDQYGDCGAAAETHIEMTTAKAAGATGPDPNSTVSVDRYCQYVGSRTPPGPGVVLAKYLLWLYQNGWIKAFAPVDYTNKAQCDAFMQAGFGLYVGVALTDNDEQDFQNGTTWGQDGVAPVSDPNNGHCLAPGTRVLTDDLRWVPIEELQPGDGLVGFTENVSPTDRRRYQRSVVEAIERIDLPCLKMTFSDGTEVVCSTDHQWLTKQYVSGKATFWCRADAMEPGVSRVAHPFSTWETDDTRGGGYLAAAFDGEGWYSRSLGFCQRENEMLEEVRTALKERGFVFNDYLNHRPQPENFTRSEDIHTFTIGGVAGGVSHQSRPEIMRFLGSIRPSRLLSKFSADRLGSTFYDPWVTLVAVEEVGVQTVVAVQTTSRTFIAEGMLSHNCIVKVKADGKGLDGYVTWGQVQMATEQWTEACLQEAWLVVTTEEQLAKFTPALLADIQALGGTGGSTPVQPTPQPQPQPQPTPAPTPTPQPPAPTPNIIEDVVVAIDQAFAGMEQSFNTFRTEIADLLHKLL
jgi:hypothetical protein